MKKKDKISAHIYFTATSRVWINLLVKNGFSLLKTPKVALITLCVLVSLPLRLIESCIDYFNNRKTINIQDPIFIIGHWRSGTTFLHYLLAEDKSLGYLSMYQSFIPNISVAGGSFIRRIIGPAIPKKRPQDNIEIGANRPAEEENAIANFSMKSASHSFFFPKNEAAFKKYALFEGINKKEKKAWQRAYKKMIAKISWTNNHKRLIIKNPHNTGRIKELLELYPNAHFIHIHRDPLDVIPSTYLMYDKVVRTQYLQEFSSDETMDKIFYYFRTMMNRFVKTKLAIPRKQLFEIRFEDLEQNGVSVIRDMYEYFDWDFASSERAFVDFIEKRKHYKKNNHKLDAKLKARIEEECAFFSKNYHYQQLAFKTG